MLLLRMKRVRLLPRWLALLPRLVLLRGSRIRAPLLRAARVPSSRDIIQCSTSERRRISIARSRLQCVQHRIIAGDVRVPHAAQPASYQFYGGVVDAHAVLKQRQKNSYLVLDFSTDAQRAPLAQLHRLAQILHPSSSNSHENIFSEAHRLQRIAQQSLSVARIAYRCVLSVDACRF